MTEPINILIVDDDEGVLISLERLLESEGYCTVTAWSGREALQVADTRQFDFLLVDEHLSDVEATTLCDEFIRRQPGALRFLLHTRKHSADKLSTSVHRSVCKWEHAELKDQIRECLAA